MTARTALAALCLLAAIGCSGGELLDSSESVCDEFAAHARDGLPADERPEVVRSIGGAVRNAAEPIREAHDGLARTVGGSDSGYRLAADGFAQACIDNGWDG